MLTLQVPISQPSETAPPYLLTAEPLNDKSGPVKIKISLTQTTLSLAVEGECGVTWEPLVDKLSPSTAPNSTSPSVVASPKEHEDAQSESPKNEDGMANDIDNIQLSWNLQEFSKDGILRPNILDGEIDNIDLMLICHNYALPHAYDHDLSETSSVVEARWADKFPAVIILGSRVLTKLSSSYSSVKTSEGRRFIMTLAKLVQQRSFDWVEELWVGERERYDAYAAKIASNPVDFNVGVETAISLTNHYLKIALLECDAACRLFDVDRSDNVSQPVLNAALWISTFDGPYAHLAAYVRELIKNTPFDEDADQWRSIFQIFLLPLARNRLFLSLMRENRDRLERIDCAKLYDHLQTRDDRLLVITCLLFLAQYEVAKSKDLLESLALETATVEQISEVCAHTWALSGIIDAEYFPKLRST